MGMGRGGHNSAATSDVLGGGPLNNPQNAGVNPFGGGPARSPAQPRPSGSISSSTPQALPTINHPFEGVVPYLSRVTWRPTSGDVGVPRRGPGSQEQIFPHFRMIASSFRDMNDAQDLLVRPGCAARFSVGGAWSETDIVAVASYIVSKTMDIHLRGAIALSLRIPGEEPSEVESELTFEERIGWLSRIIKDHKGQADALMRNWYTEEIICAPIRWYAGYSQQLSQLQHGHDQHPTQFGFGGLGGPSMGSPSTPRPMPSGFDDFVPEQNMAGGSVSLAGYNPFRAPGHEGELEHVAGPSNQFQGERFQDSATRPTATGEAPMGPMYAGTSSATPAAYSSPFEPAAYPSRGAPSLGPAPGYPPFRSPAQYHMDPGNVARPATLGYSGNRSNLSGASNMIGIGEGSHAPADRANDEDGEFGNL
jgi:hypothetical protein